MKFDNWQPFKGALLLAISLVSLALIWVTFAELAVPRIIESAYRGESFSFLNSLIKGQATHSVDEYLRDWDKVSEDLLLGYLVFGVWLIVFWVMSVPAFFQRFVGEATPGSLGAIRMLTCTILLVNTLWEDLSSTALLPLEAREPMGLLQVFYLLPHFEGFVSSASALRTFESLTAGVLFLGAVGWKTRLVIPVGAVCYFLLGGILRQYSHYFHTMLTPLYLMVFLSFMPCGDGWSIDRLMKVYHGRSVPLAHPSPVYGWSRYICWAIVAMTYLLAALSKIGIGGVSWWNATTMRTNLFEDSLNPMQFNWTISLALVPAPDWLFAGMALIALLGESFYVLVLFSRTARIVFPSLMFAMHVGIFLLQNILFLDLILLQAIFFDFTRLRKAIGERLALRRGKIQILYDGLCPLCRRTIRVLNFFDLFERLEPIDFRRMDLEEYNYRHRFNLRIADLDREMYVIRRERLYSGFYGYRVIAAALPAFWFLAPWLFLPGIYHVGIRIYSYVARERLRLVKCDAECPTDQSSQSRNDVSADFAQRSGILYPLITAGLIGLMISYWWYVRYEYYPFTTYPMYSDSKTSGVLYYYRVLAYHDSGLTSRAHIERGIGAMADTRYRDIIRKCFKSPTEVQVCTKVLLIAAREYNSRTRPGDEWRKLEIQKMKWDFLSNPSDPQHGVMEDRFVIDIN